MPKSASGTSTTGMANAALVNQCVAWAMTNMGKVSRGTLDTAAHPAKRPGSVRGPRQPPLLGSGVLGARSSPHREPAGVPAGASQRTEVTGVV